MLKINNEDLNLVEEIILNELSEAYKMPLEELEVLIKGFLAEPKICAYGTKEYNIAASWLFLMNQVAERSFRDLESDFGMRDTEQSEIIFLNMVLHVFQSPEDFPLSYIYKAYEYSNVYDCSAYSIIVAVRDKIINSI